MHLNVVPLIFVLVGLTLYTVLGGADFGAGMWALTAGGGSSAERIRITRTTRWPRSGRPTTCG